MRRNYYSRKMKIIYCTFFIAVIHKCLAISFLKQNTPTPIVLWHGMGDSCCFPFSIGGVKTMLESELPGVYVHSLRIGNSIVKDVENGYFMEADKQIEYACEVINNDKMLQGGYNAIGFSQGGQFLRAVAQRCSKPQMRHLISLGGQHQGVYGLPNCASLSHPTCDYIRKLLNFAAYYSWVQHALVQASYWHDPLNEHLYQKASIFLADINNELTINKTYISNLQQLQKLVLVRFENDTIVQPVATEWFGFYKPGQARETISLQNMDIYKQDRLGLKQMDIDGKLDFVSCPGNHLHITPDWFIENIVNKYLKQ